jgi:RNA polymerase sigma-70 factor, ECF subfamily
LFNQSSGAGLPPTDDDLIQRIAARDPDATAELFRRHASSMFALSYRIARDQTLAEDAIQDARLQAWRDAGRYDPARGSVLAWLLVITKGRTLDRLRAQQLRHDRIRPGFDPDTASAASCPADVAFERRERLGVVDAVLDVLPAPDRRTLELAYFEGLTHTEIADRLALPLGTAKTQLRRALQTLRIAVDDRPRHPFVWRAPATPHASMLAGADVLAVDDEPDTVKLTTLVLKRAGATVVAAASGAQAMACLEAQWPDVALIDLEMPDVDGFELLMRLQQLSERCGRRLPAVAFTARGSDRDRQLTHAAGFAAHLLKPIRPVHLVAAVANLTGH